MSLSKDLVGKEFPSFYYEVSREKIKEFLRALNETKEVYWDKEKAKEAGFSDTRPHQRSALRSYSMGTLTFLAI